ERRQDQADEPTQQQQGADEGDALHRGLTPEPGQHGRGRQEALTLGELARQQGERSEEHTSELQSLTNLVCRLLLEKKNKPPVTRPAPGRPPAKCCPGTGCTRPRVRPRQ